MCPVQRLMSVIACCAGLASCLVIPYPREVHEGYEPDSRENLTEQVPAFIIPAQTTRERVLLTLGAPDGVASDESWFTYSTIWREKGFAMGGVLIGYNVDAVGYDNKVRVRRLLVHFDAQGLVSGAEIQEQTCTRSHFTEISRPATRDLNGDCLDPQGTGHLASARKND